CCSCPAVPRPVCRCSSAIRLAACALVSVSSMGSPASSQSVFKYECCAAVMGSLPVVHSSGSLRTLPGAGLCCVPVLRCAIVLSSYTHCLWRQGKHDRVL